jgi:RHS repeat-associated protein
VHASPGQRVATVRIFLRRVTDMERRCVLLILMLFAFPTQATLQMYYLHNDHLGTPRVVTNQAREVVWKGQLKPFGEISVEVEAITNHRRFPGQQFDIDSRLYYNYFRDYDPRTGRYVQSDPIGLRGGSSTYAYVEGNPVNYADPRGLVKLYGNWCGPNWSGGFKKSYDQMDSVERVVALAPNDKLDSCCRDHDITYAQCRVDYPCDKKSRSKCMRDADRRLSNCSTNVGGGQSPMALLFGNPQDRISGYMRDSYPDGGHDRESCECEKNH